MFRWLQNQNEAKNRKTLHYFSGKQPKKHENAKKNNVAYFFRFFQPQNFRTSQIQMVLFQYIEEMFYLTEQNVLGGTKCSQKCSQEHFYKILINTRNISKSECLAPSSHRRRSF